MLNSTESRNMDRIDTITTTAIEISAAWTPSRDDLENLAVEQAMLCGRDWTDCGEYEREMFRDEARRMLGIDPR